MRRLTQSSAASPSSGLCWRRLRFSPCRRPTRQKLMRRAYADACLLIYWVERSGPRAGAAGTLAVNAGGRGVNRLSAGGSKWAINPLAAHRWPNNTVPRSVFHEDC
jgi:hypothetical protein